MKRNISETPERWVILKIPDNNYKVFGTWAGGYLGEDRWKLNSGIKKVEQDDDFYYFIGFSGSQYKCHKKGYGVITSYGRRMLNQIIEQGNGEIKLMEDADDWLTVISNPAAAPNSNIMDKEDFAPHFLQYWDYVKDVIDDLGWIYSNDVPHLLDAYFEGNTGQEIEFQKSYEGQWRGYRWRPKSISQK